MGRFASTPVVACSFSSSSERGRRERLEQERNEKIDFIEIERKKERRLLKEEKGQCEMPPNERQNTYVNQSSLKKLPIPELTETLERYKATVKPLQSAESHARTVEVIEKFVLEDGPKLQKMLIEYAEDKDSYGTMRSVLNVISVNSRRGRRISLTQSLSYSLSLFLLPHSYPPPPPSPMSSRRVVVGRVPRSGCVSCFEPEPLLLARAR